MVAKFAMRAKTTWGGEIHSNGHRRIGKRPNESIRGVPSAAKKTPF